MLRLLVRRIAAWLSSTEDGVRAFQDAVRR